jgi:serine/threonine-protein kinase RsbW
MSGSQRRGRQARQGKGTNGPVPADEGAIKETIASDYDVGFQEVQRRILGAAEKRGYRSQVLFALKMALEEALVNAIKHGNKNDKGKRVLVEASFSPQQAEISIEDEGPGFDRKSVPDPLAEENLEKPSGRGILLIESYMTKVFWENGGRRVRMIKQP